MATKNPQPQQQPQAQEPPTAPPVTPVRQADEPKDDGQPADAGHKLPSHKKKPKVPTWVQSWRTWQKVIAVAEIVLAGAIVYYAAVQAYLSEGQLDAMKTQTDQTEKTLGIMQDERAGRIEIPEPTLVNDGSTDNTVAVKVGFKNVGESPVAILQAAVSVDPVEGFDYVKLFQRSDMDPEGEMWQAFVSAGKYELEVYPGEVVPFSNASWTGSPGEHSAGFVVPCVVQYKDTYGRVRIARRCFQYRPSERDFVTIGRYEPAGERNNSDDGK
jgi:hypothetical protein